MLDDARHIPVLVNEVLSFFPTHAQHVVDGTLGDGGHTKAILARFKHIHVLGIDADVHAINRARVALADVAEHISLIQGSYEKIPEILAEEGVKKTDCILLDLGFSSPQIDNPERGLSFQHKGPLDMRYNLEQPLTAHTILNTWDGADIERILREYGEERNAKALAHAIIQKRKTKTFENTEELVETILEVYRHKLKSSKEVPWIGGKHPATQTFQAIRIAVNDELNTLSRTLQKLIPILNKNGRLMVISFHSLEDRIVKHFFKHEARSCLCPPELPQCICDHEPQIRIITKKGIKAEEKEQKINPRSRSAILRVVEKI